MRCKLRFERKAVWCKHFTGARGPSIANRKPLYLYCFFQTCSPDHPLPTPSGPEEPCGQPQRTENPVNVISKLQLAPCWNSALLGA